MAKLVSSASMIRILKQALHSKIEAYGLFVYIKIELCGSHRIAVLDAPQISKTDYALMNGRYTIFVKKFSKIRK